MPFIHIKSTLADIQNLIYLNVINGLVQLSTLATLFICLEKFSKYVLTEKWIVQTMIRQCGCAGWVYSIAMCKQKVQNPFMTDRVYLGLSQAWSSTSQHICAFWLDFAFGIFNVSILLLKFLKIKTAFSSWKQTKSILQIKQCKDLS